MIRTRTSNVKEELQKAVPHIIERVMKSLSDSAPTRWSIRRPVWRCIQLSKWGY